jgi:hypothetical protein
MLEAMSGDFILVKHTPTLALPRLLDLFKAEDFPFLNEGPCVPVSAASSNSSHVTILSFISFAPESSFSFSSAGLQDPRNRASITFLVWLCYDVILAFFYCHNMSLTEVFRSCSQPRLNCVLSSVFFLE